MASTQATRYFAAIVLVLFGGAYADDTARDREAKRQGEERMRGNDLPIYREYRPPTYSYSELHQRFSEAAQLEREGNTREAVKAYAAAARAGSGKAAARLGEIYHTGIPGVARNPDEAVQWNNFARMMGEDVPKPPARQ